MKPSTRRKTLLAVVMTLIMSLAFAGTAFAASITLDGNTAGHKYEAYQIFSGKYDKQDGQDATLSDVKWGAGVDESKIDYAALSKALGTEGLDSAAKVADYLSTAADGEKAAADFADYIAGCLKQSVLFDTSGENPIAKNLDQGYYLVKDQDGSLPVDENGNASDTATKFMMRVVGDDKATVKSSVTESEKFVQEDDDNTDAWKKYADMETAQQFEFMLTSTVPGNVAKYKNYWVTFKDTMSAGIDPVLVADGAKAGLLELDVYVIPGSENPADENFSLAKYTVKDKMYVNVDEQNGEKKFEYRFDSKDGFQFQADTKIVLVYKAKLNADAIVGNDGNLNDFYTEYNRNPNVEGDGDKGTTPEDEVIVFTYELDTNKVDETGKALEGAGFKLYRASDNLWAVIGTNGKVSDWVANEADASELDVLEGTKFIIRGLDSKDKYYLHEVKTPAGYNSLDHDLELVITSTIVPDNTVKYKIDTLNLSVDGKSDNTEADPETGIVTQNVENRSGAGLPSTGGMGTIIFTVVGIAVMVVAAVVFVTRRRRSANLA